MTGLDDWGGQLGLPQMVEFEPTETCNLRCRMCHVSYTEYPRASLFDPSLIKKMSALKGAFVAVGSGFEPMMHPQFARIVGELSDLDMRLQLITNGTYCNKDNIAALRSANLFMLNFSFDGIRQATYEHIRRRANYDEVISKILATRAALSDRETFFAVNSTCQRLNLEETIETIDFWDRHDFDMVRFLLMVVRFAHADVLKQSLYPICAHAREVFDEAARHIIEGGKRIVMQRIFHLQSPVADQYPNNIRDRWVFSDHPGRRIAENYREIYQLGAHPQMRLFDCRAAFNSVSILPNGSVQMCYKYTIGSLHDADFEDIWFGEEANKVRRQIMSDAKDCLSCDCYRYGIALKKLDDDLIENHFSHDIIPHLHSANFETGEISMPPRPPLLVASENGYNIVLYAGEYAAIPISAGAFEVDKVDLRQIPGVKITDRFPKAMDYVRRNPKTMPC